MRIRVLLLAMLVVTPPLAAQHATAGSNLGVFTSLQGEWDGEAWMIIGPGPEVRYDMRVVDGRWIEKGFASRDDGKSWNQFMEMTLARK